MLDSTGGKSLVGSQLKLHALLVFLLILSTCCSRASGLRTKVVSGSLGDDDRGEGKIRLQCENKDQAGQLVPGSVFFLNGIDVRTNLTTGEYDEEDGEIKFTRRQELEGDYTCYAGGNCPDESSCERLTVVATPSANTSIPLYYLKKFGESVTMICGVRQGLLASRYTAEWITNQEAVDVEDSDTYSGRVYVNREELKDYSLTISPLNLTDSIEYRCSVKVERVSGQLTPVQSPAITLLVYDEPSVHIPIPDTIHVANITGNPSLSFTCQATGSPNLTISWKTNNKMITTSSENFNINSNYRVGAGSSTLTIQQPMLSNSGRITCTASIAYLNVTENGRKGTHYISRTISTTRNLVVFDSSLEPRPFATQDADLLLRMDIPDQATIPESTKIRLRIIPRNSYNTTEISGIPVDDVFFEGTRFYAFVPASQLFGHRQFHVQVALEFDGKIGPYSPETASELQYIDIDETIPCDNYELARIIGGVLGGLLVLVIVVAICITCCISRMLKAKVKCEQIDGEKEKIKQNVQKTYMTTNTQQCQNVMEMLQKAREILHEEQESPNCCGVLVGQLKRAIPSLIETHELLARRKPGEICRNRNGVPRGGINPDGGLEDFTGGDDAVIKPATDTDNAVKEDIKQLMQDIEQALSTPCDVNN